MHKITRQKLNHLRIQESVPISESNKKETWLLGSCIIHLVYALHIPITIALSKKGRRKWSYSRTHHKVVDAKMQKKIQLY